MGVDNGVADNGVQTIGVEEKWWFLKGPKPLLLGDNRVHNPSVGRSVAATCVHELLHKGTFERFCLNPGFAKEENAFLSYYSVTPAGVLFLIPRPKSHGPNSTDLYTCAEMNK